MAYTEYYIDLAAFYLGTTRMRCSSKVLGREAWTTVRDPLMPVNASGSRDGKRSPDLIYDRTLALWPFTM